MFNFIFFCKGFAQLWLESFFLKILCCLLESLKSMWLELKLVLHRDFLPIWGLLNELMQNPC